MYEPVSLTLEETKVEGESFSKKKKKKKVASMKNSHACWKSGCCVSRSYVNKKERREEKKKSKSAPRALRATKPFSSLFFIVSSHFRGPLLFLFSCFSSRVRRYFDRKMPKAPENDRHRQFSGTQRTGPTPWQLVLAPAVIVNSDLRPRKVKEPFICSSLKEQLRENNQAHRL